MRDVAHTLEEAAKRCSDHGERLTTKRAKVLDILLNSAQPLSAYDISERYKQSEHEQIPVMSIYRMLGVLQKVQLVHKLDTTNQYVACDFIDHACCSTPHQHGMPQFFICDSCHAVVEQSLDALTTTALLETAQSIGFSLSSAHLELHGVCQTCQADVHVLG